MEGTHVLRDPSVAGPATDVSVLYRLTDRLYRAQAQDDIFDAALDAILETLACDAASILLFDDQGVMRFRAWRGISDDYREAVDGHSPWKPGTRDAEPIFVADIGDTSEPAWLKQRILGEGIRGLAFIPIMADHAVVGKFMTYFAHRHFATDRERELAITIAKQVGFALERKNAELLRRKMEEQLRLSERRFRQITEDAPVMIWTSDVAGHCSHLNAMLRSFWGVDLEQIPSFDFTTTIHPDDVDHVTRTIGEAHVARQPVTLQGRYRFSDGGYRILETVARPNIGDDGVFNGMIGANVDVTERVEAERALRESERRFRLLADAMPQLVWTASGSGQVDYWNQRIEEYAEAISEDGRSIDWRRLVHPSDLSATEKAWEAAVAAQSEYQFTHRLKLRDGRYRWHLSRANPISDDTGSIHHWFGTATDVHELRLAQEKLMEGEQRQRVATSAAGLGVYEWNIQNDTTIFENARTYEILGLDPDGPTINFAEFRGSFLHPEDLDAVLQAIEAAKTPGATLHATCRIYRRSDGDLRWLDLAGSFVFDESGLPQRLVGVVADITDKRRADDHRELLINELNHRVKNTLAVVQAMAMQTFRRPGEADSRLDVFAGRLGALAHAHNLLSSEGWTKAYLEDVARQTLPVDGSSDARIALSGPPVILSPKQAVTMAMALHELYTNALKYGALSDARGRVNLNWIATPDKRLSLIWKETDGPRISHPERRGFGSTMIEQALAAEFEATVHLDYAASGLTCAMEAALPRHDG